MQTTASMNYFDSNRKTDTDILEAESSMRNASKTNPIALIFVGIFLLNRQNPRWMPLRYGHFQRWYFDVSSLNK